MTSLAPPLSFWPSLAGLPHAPQAGGLINESFVVGVPPVAVVQRVHRIFGPSVHEDIEAVTAWIAARGLETPRLLPTVDGALYTIDAEGRCWRALTWIPGRSFERLVGAGQARAAGALVGRWHAATADLKRRFAFTRPGAHDTAAHMATLIARLDAHPDHRLRAQVGPLADEIMVRWASWEGRLDGPLRVCHGDLKISNLRFGEDGEGLCLLDLDTMANMALDIEMGDAMRSWCNPVGEDAAETRFDGAWFAAAMGGWLSAFTPSRADQEAIVPGIERICLELAARFAGDALEESYFGWDPARFGTRGDHNLLRATGQLGLARSVAAQRAALEASLRA